MKSEGCGIYFERAPGSPPPLSAWVSRRVAFHEVDLLGQVWYGCYAVYFEEAAAALRREYGLSHQELFVAGVRAPIVRWHADYHAPLRLDDEITIIARLCWHEGSRLNIEYDVIRPDRRIAATGYTVQLFTDATTGELLLASPDILERCRRRWLSGEWKDKPCTPWLSPGIS